MIPPISAMKTPKLCQKKSDGSARIGARSTNANQNTPFQRVTFPYSAQVHLPSLQMKLCRRKMAGAAAGFRGLVRILVVVIFGFWLF